jgi:eukaryotic-like serine/threonine-protein kinase
LIRRIDRYELLEQVGTGGMSVVYRGRDTALDREVAVKVLHPHLATKAESRARFSREARAVARLSHPGIVEIYDYSGDAAEESWLVTEFVHGRTLRAFADEVGIPLPECGALIGVALADALVHAHAAGVIHRDLKPENVMIAEVGDRPSVKLADFGIARILSQDDRMTMTGALVGSPNHMAPEIVEGDEADERSDVFSLGTILYWLCTGRLPFEAPNPTATLRRLVTGDFQDPRSASPALSEPFARIIRSTLAHDPEARPRNAADVRDQLVAALREDGIDRPDDSLAAFLAAPQAMAEALRPRLVETRLRRGEEHLSRGETALALAAFDGVLALDPGQPDVLRHLEGIARRDRNRRWLRRGALAAGGAALLGLSALALERLPAASSDSTRSPAPAPAAGGPAVVEAERSPASEPPPPGSPGTGPAITASPGAESKQGPVPRTQAPAPAAPAATPPKTPARLAAASIPLTVHVRPYAQRALLDGVEVASGQQRVVFNLSPGVHHLRIEHPCCEPFDREVDTATATPGGELKVPLTPRPGSLRVTGEPATRVFLDGKLLGTAGDSQREPFRVPVPQDGQSPYEGVADLRLEAPGRPVASAPVRIRAGQEITVPVVQPEDPIR